MIPRKHLKATQQHFKASLCRAGSTNGTLEAPQSNDVALQQVSLVPSGFRGSGGRNNSPQTLQSNTTALRSLLHRRYLLKLQLDIEKEILCEDMLIEQRVLLCCMQPLRCFKANMQHFRANWNILYKLKHCLRCQQASEAANQKIIQQKEQHFIARVQWHLCCT